MWDILKWQVDKYNGVDSTSLPVEKAQELLSSLVYTITLVAQEEGISDEGVLQSDFFELITRGQKLLDQRRKEGFEKWNALCLHAPKLHNVYYVDTMKNLGIFYKSYEIYYAADQIPCSIDYPLMLPVSEDLKGISYIEAYIRHIEIENEFINYFDSDLIDAFLKKALRDDREDYANLCEPAFINAIGRTIINQNLDQLVLQEADMVQLSEFFLDKTTKELCSIIRGALDDLCVEMHIEKEKATYFSEEISSLAIRIENAIETNCLSNIFIVEV